MSNVPILRLGSVKDPLHFQAHLRSLQVSIPCDTELAPTAASPFFLPLHRDGIKIGNRIAINPMEGWDGTADGNPSDSLVRRWQKFGPAAPSSSGAEKRRGLRGGSRQSEPTGDGTSHARKHRTIARRADRGTPQGNGLRRRTAHRPTVDALRPLLPPARSRSSEPRILYHHPILDRRLNLPNDYPVLTDAEIETIIENFHTAPAHPGSWASISWTSSIATAISATNS